VEKRAYRDLTAQQELVLLRTALTRTPNAALAKQEIIRFFDQPIEWIARDVSPSLVLLEDLKQEGRVALLMAIRRFNLTHGTRLLTYAGKGIRRRMVRFIRTERKHCHCGPTDRSLGDTNNNPTISFSDEALKSDEERCILSRIAKPEMSRILSNALEPLTERQRTIIYLRFWQNKTLAEIGNTLGISCTSVFRELHSSLVKIKRVIPPAYNYYMN